MAEWEAGDLILCQGRQGRILSIVPGDIAVISIGDPLRHDQRCEVIAVPLSSVQAVAVTYQA